MFVLKLVDSVLKATVQNIRVPEQKPVPTEKADNDEERSENSDEQGEDFEIVEKGKFWIIFGKLLSTKYRGVWLIRTKLNLQK